MLKFQKISFFLSIIAIALSVISIISVNKLQLMVNNIDNIDNNKVFKPIKDIPDVEIVKPDGSITKINATESKDELSKIIAPKQEKKDENKIIEQKNTTKDVNKNENIKPISRIDSKQNNIKKENIQPNIVKKEEPKQENTKIFGNFVVQIGAFKDKKIAEQSCLKAKQYLNGKNCNVATTNNKIYRSIIYPFDSNESASKYKDNFSLKTHISGLVKKNV